MSSNAESQLIADVALANRILVQHGVLDAFGHVSARSTVDPEVFLLSRNRAPGLVGPGDILRHRLDGTTDSDERLYLERFIHGEIYRARPDVMGIVHSHSPGVIPFGMTQAELSPVIHTAGFLGEGVARFDTRDEFGETDLLVRDQRMGESLATALGNASVVLMRGHGSVAVANSVRLATYRAIYTEVNARVQAQAMSLGTPEGLSQTEALSADATNSGQIDRLWTVWADAVGATG